MTHVFAFSRKREEEWKIIEAELEEMADEEEDKDKEEVWENAAEAEIVAR